MRAILLVHRWCGIVLCLLVAAWCLSGLVMIYVPYPSFDARARLESLQPLSLTGCCRLAAVRTVAGNDTVESFTVNMFAGKPVLRLVHSFGASSVIDLTTGALIEEVSPAQALRVAADFARNLGSRVAPRLLGRPDFDQWTVSGYSAHAPMYRFALGDARGTEIYLSNWSGEVVQRTTAAARRWNYVGAVTHWLYPTVLRQHGALWSRIVIWGSLISLLLVITGLYVGWVLWRPREARASPFRGVTLWHHYAGLLFGVLGLGWLGSGLVSMNPWGFLDGGSSALERQQLALMQPTGAQAVDVIERCLLRGLPRDVRQLRAAPFAGELFVLAEGTTGTQRLDATDLQPASLSSEALQAAARRLQPGIAPASAELMSEGDAYYYAHKSAVPLPVFRVVLRDAEASRYYIDPTDGTLLRKIDSNGRWWRWLFSALHQWDYAPMRQRPWWDVIVVTLLLALSTLALTGVWIGARYLLRR